MIIIPRFTLDDEIFDEITTQSVLFRSQIKYFCTHKFFTDLMKKKLLPYLTYQRKRYNYSGKAIIIMNGFKGHEKIPGNPRKCFTRIQFEDHSHTYGNLKQFLENQLTKFYEYDFFEITVFILDLLESYY